VPNDDTGGAGEPAENGIGKNTPNSADRRMLQKPTWLSGIKVRGQTVPEHEDWLPQQDQRSSECHQYQVLNHVGSKPLMI
jgi:hypothetical protein